MSVGEWLELPDLPRELEGQQCWKWIEGKPHRPWIDIIPQDYSRLREHCGGIWVWPLSPPQPPGHVSHKKEG